MDARDGSGLDRRETLSIALLDREDFADRAVAAIQRDGRWPASRPGTSAPRPRPRRPPPRRELNAMPVESRTAVPDDATEVAALEGADDDDQETLALRPEAGGTLPTAGG